VDNPKKKMTIHWLPLTLDYNYIKDVVKKAKQLDVDAFHLSHRLVHDANDVINDANRRKIVQQVVDIIKNNGFECWCWTHEIHQPPAEMIENGFLILDDERLKTHLMNKYSLLKKYIPSLDGIVLTFAETQYEVYKNKNVITKYENGDTAEYRVKYLIDMFYGVCKSLGWKLAIRDFVYRKAEIDTMLSAIKGIEHGIAVMSKCVPHDWHPYYPDNPVLGKVGNRQQWIEFDLGHEYEGQTMLPYADPYLITQRIRNAFKNNIKTVCVRLDRYGGRDGFSAVYQPWGDLEIRTVSHIAKNINASVDEVIEQWESEHFHGAWEIVKLSTDMVNTFLFPKKLWIANHSNLPDFNYAKSHLTGGNADRISTWTQDPADLANEMLADKPTKEWYNDLLKGRMANDKRFDKIISILSKSACKDAKWNYGIEMLKMWNDLFWQYHDAYFAIRLYQNSPIEMSKKEALEKVYKLETLILKYEKAYPDIKLTDRNVWKQRDRLINSLKEQLV